MHQLAPALKTKALNVVIPLYARSDHDRFAKLIRKYNEEEAVVVSPPVAGEDLIVFLPGHHPANFGEVRAVEKLTDDQPKYQVQTIYMYAFEWLFVYLMETTDDPSELS